LSQLQACDALSLLVKCRKLPQSDQELLTEEDIMGFIELIRSEEGISADTAFLKLLVDYAVCPQHFYNLSTKLRESRHPALQEVTLPLQNQEN
jgi:hypothetical protein